MHVPDVASFEFAHGNSEIFARPYSAASEAEILDAYQNSALPFVMQARGTHEALHASAVQTKAGFVVGICGASESGKSTIAFGLAARGRQQWGDDALVLRLESPAHAQAVPLPFKPKLRKQSAEYFRHVGVPSAGVGARRETEAPLGGVFVTEAMHVDALAAHRIRQLSPGEALRSLLPHAYRFRPDTRARRRRMLSAYLDLVRDVPVWHIQYPIGLEHLDGVLDAIDARIE